MRSDGGRVVAASELNLDRLILDKLGADNDVSLSKEAILSFHKMLMAEFFALVSNNRLGRDGDLKRNVLTKCFAFIQGFEIGQLKASDDLLNDVYDLAYTNGYKDGFRDGYSQGYAAGYRDGYAIGYGTAWSEATKIINDLKNQIKQFDRYISALQSNSSGAFVNPNPAPAARDPLSGLLEDASHVGADVASKIGAAVLGGLF